MFVKGKSDVSAPGKKLYIIMYAYRCVCLYTHILYT